LNYDVYTNAVGLMVSSFVLMKFCIFYVVDSFRFQFDPFSTASLRGGLGAAHTELNRPPEGLKEKQEIINMKPDET